MSGGVVVAVTGLFYANVQDQRQRETAQEGQVTDRYTAAVANLGAQEMDLRIGGIYALQRIMQDSPRDQPAVCAVLTEYIRARSQEPEDAPDPAQSDSSTTPNWNESGPLVLNPEPPADVQVALDVLVRRDAAHDGLFRLRLTGSDLTGAHLSEAEAGDLRVAPDLSGADLALVNLKGAILGGADFSNANMNQVNLQYTVVFDTDFSGAQLWFADFSGGNILVGANMAGASLNNADLSDVEFLNSILIGADFTPLPPRGGSGEGESGIDWGEPTNLSGADLTGAVLTGADLRGVDLSNTEVSVEQLLSARIDRDTKFPPDIAGHQELEAHLGGQP